MAQKVKNSISFSKRGRKSDFLLLLGEGARRADEVEKVPEEQLAPLKQSESGG